MPPEPRRYYGKYRGTVLNNVDPMRQGRLMLQVPDVALAVPTTWAMACVPVAGQSSGAFLVPAIGAGVWVEFEQGDPNYPIWSGGWWGSSAELPPLALASPPGVQAYVLQTQLGATLMVSDAPGPNGGILLRTMSGAMIMVNSTGITISNGQGATLTLIGPTVSINQGALVVT